MASWHHLPAEVLLAILSQLDRYTHARSQDLLEDDHAESYTRPPTSRYACLVCRNWLAPAQSILYGRVPLTSFESLVAFRRSIIENPELGTLMTMLSVRVDSSWLYRDHRVDEEPRPAAYIIPELIGSLPNLVHLCIIGTGVELLDGPLTFANASASLTSLCVHGCVYNSPMPEIFFETLPETLTKLSISNANVKVQYAIPYLPLLRSLRIQLGETCDVEGLEVLATCPRLDALYISRSDRTRVHGLIKALGSALDRLNIREVTGEGGLREWLFPNFTTLRDLRITGPTYEDEDVKYLPGSIEVLS